MLSIKIKELREERGLSQTDMAKAFGLTQSTVGGWESGARSPKLDMLVRLADYFQVTTDYLLDRVPRSVPSLDLTDEQAELLEVYAELNHSGKRQLFGRAYDLLEKQKADDLIKSSETAAG